jgi:hypothetical protein
VVRFVRAPAPPIAMPRTVCATFDAERVVVWQAHGTDVADAAVRQGRFGGRAWRTDRVTRFRLSLPSLLARNGWGTRPGRERILAVWLAREGFDAILRQAVHAAFEPGIYASRMGWQLATRFANAIVAWHPDVDPSGAPLARETVRVGLRDAALRDFTERWVLGVEDHTEWVVASRVHPTPELPVPELRVYPLSDDDARKLAGTSEGRADPTPDPARWSAGTTER